MTSERDPFAPVSSDSHEKDEPNKNAIDLSNIGEEKEYDPIRAYEPIVAPTGNVAVSIPRNRPEPETQSVVASADEEVPPASDEPKGSSSDKKILGRFNKPNKKTTIVAVAIAAALVVGGGIGTVVALQVGGGSIIAGEGRAYPAAMYEEGLASLPYGVTGAMALDSDRFDVAEKTVTEESKKIADALSEYMPDTQKTDAISSQMAVADKFSDFLYNVGSPTYFSLRDYTPEDKSAIIDLVNSVVVDMGYSEFDKETLTAQGEDPLNQQSLYVTGVKTTKSGATMSYNVIINAADETTGAPAGMFVTVFSAPHVKSGEEAAFQKYVVNSTKK